MKERKRLGLKGYDYSTQGAYFITICSKNKGDIFGTLIENDQVFLNDIGLIIKQQWDWLAKQYSYISLDEFIIMPDHIHGIIFVCHDHVQQRKIKPIYELIGAFKTTSSKLIHKYGYNDFIWQKSFYDRIIRDEEELYNIRSYIRFNALNGNSSEQSRLFTTVADRFNKKE